MANTPEGFSDTIKSLSQQPKSFENNVLDKKKQLEATLASASKKVDLSSIESQLSKVTQQRLMNQTTKLGATPGEVVGGFKALTTGVDDVIPSLGADSQPIQNTGRLVVAQLDESVPGIGDKLVRSVTDQEGSDASSILGKESLTQPKLLDVVVAAPFPEAIATSLNNVATKIDVDVTTDELKNVLTEGIDVDVPLGENITSLNDAMDDIDEELGGFFDDAFGGILDGVKNLSSSADAMKSALGSNVLSEFSKFSQALQSGFSTVTENLVEKAIGPVKSSLSSIATIDGAKIDIPEADLKQIIQLQQQGKLNQATEIVKQYSDATDEEIQNKLISIDNTIGGVTKDTQGSANAAVVQEIVSDAKSFNERYDIRKTSAEINFPTFTIGTSTDNILNDIRSINREVTIVIFYPILSNSTATAQEFHDSQIQQGLPGLPCHYWVDENAIVKTRPLDNVIPSSTSDRINSFSKKAITVGMRGKLDAQGRNMGKKSYSSNTWKMTNQVIEALLRAYPGIPFVAYHQLIGVESDVSERQVLGWDLDQYMESKYGRAPYDIDWSTADVPTKSQLIKNT